MHVFVFQPKLISERQKHHDQMKLSSEDRVGENN